MSTEYLQSPLSTECQVSERARGGGKGIREKVEGELFGVCVFSQAQLHVLWEEVESRRRECETLRQELETARRTTALSSILDVQVGTIQYTVFYVQHVCRLTTLGCR